MNATRVFVLSVCCGLSALTTRAWAAPQAPQTAPISLEAASSEIDGRNNQLLLTKVVITQQDRVIRADQARASGLDFQNSRWVFTGKVQINTTEGQSTADEAVVNFMNNQIKSAQITGKPATFAQHDRDQALLAEGRASNMVYDFNLNTVRLTGEAWIKYGSNEFSGNSVTYDVPLRKILARSEDQQGQRVRISIKPDKPTSTSSPDLGAKP